MFWGNKYTTEEENKNKNKEEYEKWSSLGSPSLVRAKKLLFNVSWVLQERPNELHSTCPDASPLASEC
jgi:hypothetical protein